MLGLFRLTGAAAVAALLTAIPAEAAFVFTKVVDTFVAVPGSNGAKFILQGPVAVGGGKVVFCDRSKGGKYDVWAASINGTNKTKIIPEGRVMPKSFGTFKQGCHLIDIVGGNLLFIGDDCAGCGAGKGIFRMPAGGGPVTSLVDIKTNVPGSQNKFNTDWGPGGDFGSDGKNVAFYNGNGQHLWAVPLGGGTVTEVASLADVNGSPPYPDCCIFSTPTMLNGANKVLLLGRNLYDGHALMNVNVSGATNTFRFLARWNKHLLGTPQGYIITRLFAPDTGSHYVFGAVSGKSGSPEIKGLYSKNPSTGTVVKLVDKNTRVPGRTDKLSMTFGPYDVLFSAAGGMVVFASDDTGGKSGIYAVPEGGGTIVKIIRTQEPIAGRKVGALGFGRRHFDGNTVVFTVSYAGNTFVGNGVFSTPIN